MGASKGTPEQVHVEVDTEVRKALEQVRDEFGLESLDHAAELLIKRRLRKGARGLTGRGPAIYPVTGGSGERS